MPYIDVLYFSFIHLSFRVETCAPQRCQLSLCLCLHAQYWQESVCTVPSLYLSALTTAVQEMMNKRKITFVNVYVTHGRVQKVLDYPRDW